MVKCLLQQTFALTKASMKARYRKSFAGLLWVVLHPILLFFVQLLVFKNVIKIDFENYEFYLLSTFLPWQFVSQTLTMATPQFVVQGSLLKSIQLNPVQLILALALDNFINFSLAFLAIFVALNIFGFHAAFSIYLLFPAFILIYLASSALGFIFSLINVFFRDLQFILQFVLTLFYFLTPIFYQPQMYPENWQWILKLNPFYIFIEPVILIVKDRPLLEISVPIFKLVTMTIVISLIAHFYWKRRKNEFYLNI